MLIVPRGIDSIAVYCSVSADVSLDIESTGVLEAYNTVITDKGDPSLNKK